MMYYFIPKQAGRPVYSYRLSVVHFWSLIFLYMWAGPHHLHYTALPDWTQTLGMAFSIMLWMPSWGGMINGLMTLSGAWDKLRTDPALRFSVTAVGFYGMSTFEGPMMSIREVNSLAHYTDWVIGHVHSGALGWVAFISFGAIYYLVPALWRRSGLWSTRLVAWHYWVATLGIVFYITLDVGRRHHAGPDVARLRPVRVPAVLVRRVGAGRAPLLRHPHARRRAVPRRRADHGLQPDPDRAQSVGRTPRGGACRRASPWRGSERRCGASATRSSRRTRSCCWC